jgi:pSer/pThr/pTyr-binding forkhead associated (FHA) protein
MKARIEVIGGVLDGNETVISKTSFIGRDKACDVFIPADSFMSKKHALLRLGNEGYILEDLDSTNGTFINGEPVHEPVLLLNGQLFKVGQTLLKINYG